VKSKKKYLAMMTSFSSIEDGVFYVLRSTIEKISQNFDKVFIINIQNLRFFPKFSRSYYMEKNYNECEFEPIYMPKNFISFNPKNAKDFANFLEDKELIIINHISKHFLDLKVQMLVKKHKLKQVQISNRGFRGTASQTPDHNHIFKTILFYINGQLFNKLTVLFSNIGIVPKLDIRFFSNLADIEKIKKNKFKNFLYKNKLLWAKEIKLVNSMTYDIFLENKLSISEDYIVHLDSDLNNWHGTSLRGELPKEKVERHYYYLEKFLKKLSKEFNKEVIVALHPGDFRKEHELYLKDFKTLKYKTTEYIYKAFMITNFGSSAITDGILLKKRILGIKSDFMCFNEKNHTKIMAERVGYLILNIKKDYNFNKENILLEMNNKKKNYEKFTSKYHCFEPNKNGSQQIVDTIKDRFF